MKQVGTIYKIQNTVNALVYIGQTTVTNPMLRWKDHYNSYLYGSNYPLYRDMRLYGIENFTFQVVETNIPLEQLDEKEQYYIKKYDAIKKGYNILLGGQEVRFSKLCLEEVHAIIELLKQGVPMKDIAVTYGVTPSTISDINCGETWRFVDVQYPITKSFNTKNNFSAKEISDIYNLLMQGVPCTEIGKLYNVSNVTISNINNGKIYRQEGFSYPIYKAVNSKSNLSQQKVMEVIQALITTGDTYSEIGNRLSINRKTVAGVNQGILYINHIINMGYNKFPLRDNY